jgi:hypothetical protein
MAPLTLMCAVALFPALVLAQSNPQQPGAEKEKCIVTGRVMNAITGEPVKKAEVHLDYVNRQNPMSGPEGYGGLADAGGNFRFEGVEAGEYSLSADRPGFLRSRYGSKAPNQPGTTLALVPGQQISDLNMAMFPQAVISGRVVDEDGDPIQARVQVLMLSWRHGKQRVLPRRGTMSNDLGEYRVADLPPGKYYISAQSGFRIGTGELPAIPGKADVRPVRTFFPDATGLDGAAPIRVQMGQDLTGMDIRLRTLPTYHVRGRISGTLSRINLSSLGVSVSPRDSGVMFSLGGSNVTKKATFDLGGVPTGSYTLNLYDQSGNFHMIGNTPVEVSGSDVNDAVINIIPAGMLRGRIQIEGAPQANGDAVNIGSMRLQLDPVEGAGWGTAAVKQDGSFTVEELDPGKYHLVLYPLPEGTYIKSVQLGQQEMLGKELDFTQGVSGELLITLSYGVAEVSGTVQMPQQSASTDASSNKPATAASIVLVPEELRPDGSGFEYGNTTQTGTFSIKNASPGRYRAYAFEEMKRDQMDNPDFLKQLESKGVEVELKENDKKQIQLTLIPAADTQQILAQLGIDAQ